MAGELGIWLQRFAIEGFGPLKARSFELKRFNLIYGPNESGKTYLIEFLIRALFRHAPDWPLRDQLGAGKVYVAGIDQELATFSPEHDHKLEHTWEEHDFGLPLNMSRLLVVRGGELDLSPETSVEANHRMLEKALSGEELIEDMLGRIQATVQQAELVEGRIIGSNRGDLKDREQLRRELAQVSRLQQEVQDRLSGANVEQLKQEQAKLEIQLEGLERAKEHKAYLIENELQALDEKLDRLPPEQLDLLGQALRDRDRHLVDRDRLDQRISETEGRSSNYEWLEQAVEIWQGWQLEDRLHRPKWPLVLAASSVLIGMLVLIGGLLSEVTGRPLLMTAVVAVLLVLIGLAALIWLSVGLQQGEAASARAEERQAIIDEYQRRFEVRPAGLSDLKLKLETEREAHSLAKHLQTELVELQEKIQSAEVSISGGFEALQASNPEVPQWQVALDKMKSERGGLLSRKREAELELERLGVPSERRRSKAADLQYDPEVWAELETEIEVVKADLAASQQDLDGLKGEVTRYTGDSVTDPWELVLASLWDMRTDLENQYRQLTSRILAEIALTEVLTDMRAQEEEKISAALADPGLSEAMKSITGRYQSISFQANQLVVGSDTADYQFEDLSTGAQEQILLALRLGLARRLADGKPLFLLLDDAFQHSDWDRRDRLVSAFIKAAKQGWQVTYLTMDDHLRDLIKAKGQQAFGDQFSYLEL